MMKLFDLFPILSILLQLQMILLSCETQPNLLMNQITIIEEEFGESQTERNLRNQVTNEKLQTKQRNEDSPRKPNKLPNKEKNVSPDANQIEQCVEPSKPISRFARSVTKPAPKSQFEQICGTFGQQPCTCYYPDHPDITIFELSSDVITLSKMNSTGPSNCKDLQSIGYSLKGFYMVRFNNKRIQTIFCDFNQTKENTNTEKLKMPSTNQIRNSSVRPEFSQFCKGLKSQPCKVFYSDYPDIGLFDINRNTSSNNVFLKSYLRVPTDCEDLYAIGYSLKGFYWVSLNANKVKLIYCDFNETEGKYKKNLRTKRLVSQNNTSTTKNTSSTLLPHCDAVGSQSCSCYYPNVRNVLQFELSNDELTRQATMPNGTGPGSCEELKNIGYTVDGFHIVRFKTNIVKAVYCKFNHTKINKYNEESTTQSTLKPSSTRFQTTKAPATIDEDTENSESNFEDQNEEPVEQPKFDFSTINDVMNANNEYFNDLYKTLDSF